MPLQKCSSDSVLSGGRSVRFAAHEGPQYSLFACYAFTINYILGVGSLGMPYAAQEAGYAAGFILIVLVSFLSYVTVMMVARTALRAEMLVLQACENKPIGQWCYVRCIATKGEPHLPNEESLCEACAANCHMPPQLYEVVQLCDTFLGKWGRLSYQLSLVLLMYAGLLAYVLVFVATLSNVFNLSRDMSILICAVVMIPVSMMNITEMVPLQVTLSAISIISLLIMGGVGLWSAISSGWPESHRFSKLEPVNFDGLGLAFSTALFSQLFQHSVPGLINPLKREDRLLVPSVFGMALATTAVLYVFLSFGCVLAFGEELEESVNINFANFRWGANPSWIAKATSHFCGFYPALATVAVFPLITITLSNNLQVVSPLSKSFRSEHPRAVTLLFRLLAAVPPIVIALPVKSLSTAFKFAGLGGIWVAFVTPALLQMLSTRAIVERFDNLTRASTRSIDQEGIPASDSPTSRGSLSTPIFRVPFAAKRTPVYPVFNEKVWVLIVLACAALAFVITTWGIAADFSAGK